MGKFSFFACRSTIFASSSLASRAKKPIILNIEMKLSFLVPAADNIKSKHRRIISLHSTLKKTYEAKQMVSSFLFSSLFSLFSILFSLISNISLIVDLFLFPRRQKQCTCRQIYRKESKILAKQKPFLTKKFINCIT